MQEIHLAKGTYVFEVASPLGPAGGFGQVFRGHDVNGRDLAVKRLLVETSDAAARRELELASNLADRQLQHVIPFFDAGQDAASGSHFVVMPVASRNLFNFVQAEGVQSSAGSASILAEIANGLEEVADIVHRDLKPQNILQHEGRWKVADFGIARFVEDATSSHTLKRFISEQYAAPEQWRLEHATHATDIYSLGCIGYFLVTGSPPFAGDLRAAHLHQPAPALPSVDPKLSALLQIMLRKTPESRPDISRVRGILHDIVASQQTSRALGREALLSAVSTIVTQENNAEAERTKREEAAARRHALFNDAKDAYAAILGRLFERIRNDASIVSGGGSEPLTFRMGHAMLQAEAAPKFNSDQRQVDLDVIAFSKIGVTQSSPNYRWNSSLWFGKLPGSDSCRWFEVGFVHTHKGGNAPVQLDDLKDVARAMANEGPTHVAFGPVPIDDEDEDSFHERWLWLLGQGAVSLLNRPTEFPISSWPPNLIQRT